MRLVLAFHLTIFLLKRISELLSKFDDISFPKNTEN